MKLDRQSLLLYAVTDRAYLKGQTLYSQVEKAIMGGAGTIQLREKALDTQSMLAEANELLPLCRGLGVPLIINDNIEVCMLSGADGVHIGQQDMDIFEARRILGEHKIIGVSAHNVAEAIAAERGGADYIGAGAVFATGTKRDAGVLSLSTLTEICAAVSIPVVAIGGINADNVIKLKGTGIAGAAVVSGIFAQPDIKLAAEILRTKLTFVIS